MVLSLVWRLTIILLLTDSHLEFLLDSTLGLSSPGTLSSRRVLFLLCLFFWGVVQDSHRFCGFPLGFPRKAHRNSDGPMARQRRRAGSWTCGTRSTPSPRFAGRGAERDGARVGPGGLPSEGFQWHLCPSPFSSFFWNMFLSCSFFCAVLSSGFRGWLALVSCP